MSQKNVKDKLDELESIVSSFERDDISVEEALAEFERGSKLASEVESQLETLKTKITVLKESFDRQ